MSSLSDLINLSSSISSMYEYKETQNKQCLYAAIRYVDDESKKIYAVPVKNVEGLDTSNPNLDNFYHVWRDNKEYVPAQLFKVCTTEKEALADDGARRIFRKVRRSAADQEIKKKVKKAAASEARKKRQKKKLLAARDKQLSKEILNKSSTVWLVEETKDNIESATIHHAKPAKNFNVKTDNKLLLERFSTLTKDKLDFGSNETYKKQTKGVSNENKVIDETHSESFKSDKESPVGCQKLVHSIAQVHHSSDNRLMIQGKNQTIIQNKKTQPTYDGDIDALESIPDSPNVVPKNEMVIADLRQQIKSMEVSHQIAITDYKEQLVDLTKRMDTIIAQNQFLEKQIADGAKQLKYYVGKCEKLKAPSKLNEKNDCDSAAYKFGKNHYAISDIYSHHEHNEEQHSGTPQLRIPTASTSNNTDIIEISSDEASPRARRKLSFSSEIRQLNVPTDVIFPVKTEKRNSVTPASKRVASPAVSTTSFSVKNASERPSIPISKITQRTNQNLPKKRLMDQDDCLNSPSSKYPCLGKTIKEEKSDCSKNDDDFSDKVTRETSEADYDSDRYPTFDKAGDFKSFEVEDESGRKIKYYHFKFGFYIHHTEWLKLSIVNNPSIFVRQMSRLIWKSTDVLRRRALQPEKAKPIDGEPRKKLTPKKKALLQKSYRKFLKRLYVPSKREQMKNKWRSYLSTYINSLNGNKPNCKGVKQEKKTKSKKRSTPSISEQEDEY